MLPVRQGVFAGAAREAANFLRLSNENGSVFLSRAGADAAFAAEIGRILEEDGRRVILQQWDFANRNFIEAMHEALAGGARVVALLSPEYLRSDHCMAEWQNAIAEDPLNRNGRLVLLRVAECEPPGLLAGLAYWDLVPVREDRGLLKEAVLEALREGRRSGALGPYWRAPRSIIDTEAIRPTPSFTGRSTELEELGAKLSEQGVAVVHGLGGTGKSSLAREYAWRNRENYAVAWWLNAETENGIIDGLLSLGSLFVRGLDQMRDRRVAAQQVVGTMLTGFSKPVLLIFDNIEDERLVNTWRPRTGAQALVTSRSAAWGAGTAEIALETWSVDEASRYLCEESGRDDLDRAAAESIALALGALPLALAHAAAYLRTTRMVTPDRYLQRIEQHLSGVPRYAEYPRSVFATFTEAITEAEKAAPSAAAVLSFAAWFAPDAIPDELFRRGLRSGPKSLRAALEDELGLDDALGVLDRLSLLRFAEPSRAYDMHRLVQLAARDRVDDASIAWVESAVEAANFAFPDDVKFDTWEQCERILPHARAALDALPSSAMPQAAGELARKCSRYLIDRAMYSEAEPLALRALTIIESVLGPEHLQAASAVGNLSQVYFYEGRYAEAEPLSRRAFAIREKELGPEHLEVADSLNNLGNLSIYLGHYDEAELLHRRALAIRENLLGPEDPLVAASLTNLAMGYVDQGRYVEAEPLCLRALDVLEKTLGPEHPDTALSLGNLANLYFSQERYDEAEPLCVRALAIRERTLRPDHSDIAFSLNNLAIVYYHQTRYDEAERLLVRAREIWEKAHGSEHHYVGESINNLAGVHRGRRQYDEAEALYLRALAIREKALGAEHPYVGASLVDLASLYGDLGRHDDAKLVYERALAIQEKELGPDHPSTSRTRAALAALR